jgi:hypothetical protein
LIRKAENRFFSLKIDPSAQKILGGLQIYFSAELLAKPAKRQFFARTGKTPRINRTSRYHGGTGKGS